MEGILSPSHPLSPHRALRELGWLAQPLVAAAPRSLWEQDTQSLPPAAAAYRRRVRRFAQRELAPRALELDLQREPQLIERVLEAAGRAGLLSDLLPAPLGSIPPGLLRVPFTLAQSLKMEELCAACAGLGLMVGASALGAVPLVLAGQPRALARHVVPAFRHSLRSRPALFAFAITEPSGGSDVEESEGALRYVPGTVARRAPGGWRLHGRKVFISGGALAQRVTVFAALEGEGMESWTCFVVGRGAPGFSVARTELKMGQRASEAAELVFDGVFVPDADVVGGLRRGWGLNRAVLNASRVPVGAIALGIARGALEGALDFAASARLAGKGLLDYQDVQLGLAQMLIEVQAMRALVWQSANTWRPAQARASIAKVFASDAALRVCEAALELLGNHGVLHARRVEKQLRDARLTQIYEGTNQINRLAILEEQQTWLASAPHGQP